MRDFSTEIFFRTARSGGKGGQNVNKVETMVEAWWHIGQSVFFTEQEKELIHAKLKNSINKEGFLMMRSSETRSQLENKIKAKEKMLLAVATSLVVPKKRKPTRLSKAALEKRKEAKIRQSEKKLWRKKDF